MTLELPSAGIPRKLLDSGSFIAEAGEIGKLEMATRTRFDRVFDAIVIVSDALPTIMKTTAHVSGAVAKATGLMIGGTIGTVRSGLKGIGEGLDHSQAA